MRAKLVQAGIKPTKTQPARWSNPKAWHFRLVSLSERGVFLATQWPNGQSMADAIYDQITWEDRKKWERRLDDSDHQMTARLMLDSNDEALYVIEHTSTSGAYFEVIPFAAWAAREAAALIQRSHS